MNRQAPNNRNMQNDKSNGGTAPGGYRRPLPDPDRPVKSFKEYQREIQTLQNTETEKERRTAQINNKNKRPSKKQLKRIKEAEKRQARERKKQAKRLKQTKQTKRTQETRRAAEQEFLTPESAPPRRRVTKAQLRRKKKMRKFGLAVLITAVVTVGVVLVVTLLFKVKNFRIEGECRYTEQELCAAAGIKTEDNMFSFTIKTSEEQIAKTLPYIENIKVRRRLPDTVVFFVEPATEMYAVKTDEGWLVLSENLKILRTAEQAPQDISTIYGLTAEKGEVGTYLKCEDAEKKAALDTVISGAENNSLGKITAINLEDIYNMWFVVDSRFKIVLGTTVDVDYKLSFVKKIIDTELADTPKAVIDASSAHTTKRVYVSKEDF